MMRLVSGAPCPRHCKVFTNTSLPHKDGHPFSGDGMIQCFNINKNYVKYSKMPVKLQQRFGLFKGINDRSMLPLKNFSNTSVFWHDDSLYTMYDSDYYLDNSNDMSSSVQGKYKTGVHMKVMDDHLYSFTHDAAARHLVFRKDHLPYCEIQLSANFYIHDFVVTPSYTFVPTFEYNVDIGSLFQAKKSLVESITFAYDRPFQLILYNNITKKHTILPMSFVTGPVFHCAGVEKNNKVYLYMFQLPHRFQLADVTSKTGYNSTPIRVVFDLKTRSYDSVSCSLQKGEMPTYEGEVLTYASDNSLVVEHMVSGIQTVHTFFQEQLEEPRICNGYIYLVSHGNECTLLRVFDISGSLISVYRGNFESFQSFHGCVSPT